MNLATSGGDEASRSSEKPQKYFPAQGRVLKLDFEKRDIIPGLFLKNHLLSLRKA